MTQLFNNATGHEWAWHTFKSGEYVFTASGYCRLIFAGERVVHIYNDGSNKIRLDGKEHVEFIGEPDSPITVSAIQILDEVK